MISPVRQVDGRGAALGFEVHHVCSAAVRSMTSITFALPANVVAHVSNVHTHLSQDLVAATEIFKIFVRRDRLCGGDWRE